MRDITGGIANGNVAVAAVTIGTGRVSSCSIRLRVREAERTYASALFGLGRSSNWATCSLPDPAEMHMVKSGEGINGQDLGLKPHLVCDDRAITSCFRYFCTRGP